MGISSLRSIRLNHRMILLTVFIGAMLQNSIISADTWDIQVVDSDGVVGQYTSLALDQLGFPHISYYDVTNGNLKYAYLDGDGWHIETVDSAGVVGLYTSLVLDARGFSHISYMDSLNQELKYAYQDSTGWHVNLMDTEGNGVGTSMLLDQFGFPHISHGRYSIYGLYSYMDSTGWLHESIPAPCVSELGTSLALGAAGEPHITYVSYGSNDYLMWHASKSEHAWYHEVVDDEPTAGAGSSLIIDDFDVLHVSYFTVGLYWNVKYAWLDDSGWHTEVVDESNWGYLDDLWTSLALDSDGLPHFCYWRQGDLIIQHRDDSSWNREIIDHGGNVGCYPSLVLDALDRFHISYWDKANGDLKYARRVLTTIELTGSLHEEELRLTWSPAEGVVEYWVYGASDNPVFMPGFAPMYENRLTVLSPWIRVWTSSLGIGDSSTNWTYMVIATNGSEQELTRSNRLGEFDFEAATPILLPR